METKFYAVEIERFGFPALGVVHSDGLWHGGTGQSVAVYMIAADARQAAVPQKHGVMPREASDADMQQIGFAMLRQLAFAAASALSIEKRRDSVEIRECPLESLKGPRAIGLYSQIQILAANVDMEGLRQALLAIPMQRNFQLGAEE